MSTLKTFLFYGSIMLISIGSAACKKQKNVSIAGEIILFNKLAQSPGPEGINITLYRVDFNAPPTFQVTSGTNGSYNHEKIATVTSNADGTFNFGSLKLMHKERHFLLVEGVPQGLLNIAPLSAYGAEGFYSQGKFFPDEDLYFKIPLATTAEVKLDLTYTQDPQLTKDDKKTIEVEFENYGYSIYKEVNGESYTTDTSLNILTEGYGITPVDNIIITETDYFTIPPTVTTTQVSLQENDVYTYQINFP